MDDMKDKNASRDRTRKGNIPTMGRPPSRPWFQPKRQSWAERNYEIDPNRAAAVLWMFRASANGLVDSRIAAMMPSHFKPWSKKWTEEIAKTLKDRAVLGENQRYTTINGKRRPIGKPEEEFFPPIVPPELFERVQRARALPRNADLANLFAALGQCECCEQPMKFRSKRVEGGGTEGVLICNNKKCPACRVEWPYHDFEKSFYAFVKEIDDRGLIKELRLDDKAAMDLEIQVLLDVMDAKREEIKKLREQIKSDTQKIKEIKRRKNEIRDAQVEAKEPPGDSSTDYRLRSRKATLIKELVTGLFIAAAGTRPRIKERKELIRRTVRSNPDITKELIEEIERIEDIPFFIARFENKNEAIIIRDRNNPDDGIEWSETSGVETKPSEKVTDALPPVKRLLIMPMNALLKGLRIHITPDHGGKSCQ